MNEKKNLKQWLQWLESLHPSEIELGLERVTQVANCLWPDLFHADGSQSLPFKTIIVGGTNGKGSTLAFLQSILIASAYKTGTYTSPHFLHFNERIQVNSKYISDRTLCHIFEKIEALRANISLTYFEYTSLAALYYFIEQKCDVILMEVGLGGRLDAVNLLNADASLVTTVDLDHQHWLGDTIEEIAYEKAGIYRKKQCAFYGDENTPKSLLKYTQTINCDLLQYASDYSYSIQAKSWTIHSTMYTDGHLPQLKFPPLSGEIQFKNASNAIILLSSLFPQIDRESINEGIEKTTIKGRYQCLVNEKNTAVYVDVAHNLQAAKVLKKRLTEPDFVGPAFTGKSHAIFAILEDKDIKAVIKVLSSSFDSWHIIPLHSSRAISTDKIKQLIAAENKNVPISCYNDFSTAYQSVMQQIQLFAAKKLFVNKARIIVFGSFLTVAEAMNYFENRKISLHRHDAINATQYE